MIAYDDCSGTLLMIETNTQGLWMRYGSTWSKQTLSLSSSPDAQDAER